MTGNNTFSELRAFLLGPVLQAIATLSPATLFTGTSHPRVLPRHRRVTIPPSLRNHFHEYMEISVMLGGRAVIGLGRQQVVAAPGDVFFYAPNVVHYETWLRRSVGYD